MRPRDRVLPPPPPPGEFLRTEDLRKWDSNPNRFLKKWEAEGFIRRFGPGLWFVQGSAGNQAPKPVLEAWLKVYLHGSRFAVTGPMKWNELPFNYKVSTKGVPDAMVYNMSRTEKGIEFDNQLIAFSRRIFPHHPSQEWLVVDLMEYGEDYGWAWNQNLDDQLKVALRAYKLSKERLIEAAKEYGTRWVQERLRAILEAPQDNRRLIPGTITIVQQ